MGSLGFSGLGFACASPFATEVVFGVFPACMALIGGAHQDYRNRLSGKLPPEYDAQTCNVPFVALAQGRQSWSALPNEIAWTNASMAIGLAAALATRRARSLRLR